MIGNRWLNALVKLLIFLVVVHVLFLFAGYFFGTSLGVFNFPMIWPHWSSNWINVILGIIGLGVVYFVIYFAFTDNEQRRIDHK